MLGISSVLPLLLLLPPPPFLYNRPVQAEKEAKESGHTRHFLVSTDIASFHHPLFTLSPPFNPEKFSLARRELRPFLRGGLGEEEADKGRRRRSCACGSCDGPRHVAHVQVQRELKRRKKKKKEKREEGISRLETGERTQPVEGGLTTNIFNRAKNVCRVA